MKEKEYEVRGSFTLSIEEMRRLKEIKEANEYRSLSATVGTLINQMYRQMIQPQSQTQFQTQPHRSEPKRPVGRPLQPKLTMEQTFDAWLQRGDPPPGVVKPFLEMSEGKKQVLMNLDEEERNAFVNSIRAKHEDREDGLGMEATIKDMIIAK